MEEQTTTTNIDNFTELTHFFNEQHITAYDKDTSIIDIIKSTLEKSNCFATEKGKLSKKATIEIIKCTTKNNALPKMIFNKLENEKT